MRIKAGIFLLGVVGLAAFARATPIVSIGSYTMAPNSTATFAIPVSDTGSAVSENIQGMIFTLQIASGTGSTPSITSVDFLSNTVWSSSISQPVPENSGHTAQFVSYDPLTDGTANPLYISANGTLANVTFNTAGAASGTNYSLIMTGFSNTDDNSNFLNGSLGNVGTSSVVFQSGTLHVLSAVPEPTMGFLIVGAALLLPRKRNRPLSEVAASVATGGR